MTIDSFTIAGVTFAPPPYVLSWCPAHGSFAVRASQVRQSCPRCQADEYARATRAHRLYIAAVELALISATEFTACFEHMLRVDRPDP